MTNLSRLRESSKTPAIPPREEKVQTTTKKKNVLTNHLKANPISLKMWMPKKSWTFSTKVRRQRSGSTRRATKATRKARAREEEKKAPVVRSMIERRTENAMAVANEATGEETLHARR